MSANIEDGYEPKADDTTVSPDVAEETPTNYDVEDGPSPGGLPGPDFLLNMAAVQTDCFELMKHLVPIFDQYAWAAMGFVANPKTGETEQDLVEAKAAIDAVQFFMARIESTLDDALLKDMQRRLSDLRINYVNKLQG